MGPLRPSQRTVRWWASGLAPRTGPWLSLWLIHPRPEPFTGGRGQPVLAGHERWRTVVNGGAQYSKACEGASLPWVQIPPPLPLTCDDASPLCLLRGGGHRGGLSFGPQMVSVDRAGMPAAGWIGPELRPRTPADKIWEETRRVPVGAGRSPCPGRRVRQAGAAFLSPAGPPSPCARRQACTMPPRAGGTVRHRLATRQLTDRSH